jgi:hypothetical protein
MSDNIVEQRPPTEKETSGPNASRRSNAPEFP